MDHECLVVVRQCQPYGFQDPVVIALFEFTLQEQVRRARNKGWVIPQEICNGLRESARVLTQFCNIETPASLGLDPGNLPQLSLQAGERGLWVRSSARMAESIQQIRKLYFDILVRLKAGVASAEAAERLQQQ